MNVLITVYAIFYWSNATFTMVQKIYIWYKGCFLFSNFLWLTLFNRSWWVEFAFFDPSHRCVKRRWQQLSTLHIEDQLLCRATYTCAHHSLCIVYISQTSHIKRVCVYVCDWVVSHLHSWLSRLIWSATTLCSKNEASSAIFFQSHLSFVPATSVMQWAKAKMKRSWLSKSVCPSCGEERVDITFRFNKTHNTSAT